MTFKEAWEILTERLREVVKVEGTQEFGKRATPEGLQQKICMWNKLLCPCGDPQVSWEG